MSVLSNDYKKHNIYTEYYKVAGIWWWKCFNKSGPLKDYLNRKRGKEKRNCISNSIERLIADDYVKISYDERKYKLCPNAKSLRRLIYDYLLIFDCVNAFDCMDQYIKRKYRNYKKYQRMKHKLEKFWDCIKERLAKREDIIVLWTDAVSYSELEWLPKLQEKATNSLFFENAYTPTPYTKCAMGAMANKWLNIDDFDKYDLKNLNKHNSLLLRTIHKYGYKAKYFAHVLGPCVFDKEIRHFNCRERDSSCKTYFSAINELLYSEKKQVMIIHTVWETHPPYLYPTKNGCRLLELFGYEKGGIEKKRGKEYEQMRGAAEYWDKQLNFYSNLFGERTTKIYMSDHGKRYKNHNYKEWEDMANHICFFIQSKYTVVGREARLFTLENFTELIEAVMRAHQSKQKISLEEVFAKPYMRVQKVDTYNDELVKQLKAMHCEESGHAYRGIRTLEDYYLRFPNRELYYRGGDEETNLINDPKYAERIAELRALAGDYFIDINKTPKFKWARELYQ